jgi:hypothetical protein
MNENSHKVSFRHTDQKSGVSADHACTFSASEWDQLHEFLGHVADLQATQFVAKGANVHLQFEYKVGQEPYWSEQMPPEDELLAFLHRLRPLILQGEPASFLKIRGLISRELKDTPILPFLKWLLELYEGKGFQELILMESNNYVMNSEKMLVTWLNAYEYHRDHDKQEILRSHSHIAPFEWSRGVFLNLLVEKTKAIQNLGVFVELAVGKRNTISVNL